MERSPTALGLSHSGSHRGGKDGPGYGLKFRRGFIYLSIYLSIRFLQLHTTRRRGFAFSRRRRRRLRCISHWSSNISGKSLTSARSAIHSSLPAYTIWPVRLARRLWEFRSKVIREVVANTVMFFSRNRSGLGSQRSTVFRWSCREDMDAGWQMLLILQ